MESKTKLDIKRIDPVDKILWSNPPRYVIYLGLGNWLLTRLIVIPLCLIAGYLVYKDLTFPILLTIVLSIVAWIRPSRRQLEIKALWSRHKMPKFNPSLWWLIPSIASILFSMLNTEWFIVPIIIWSIVLIWNGFLYLLWHAKIKAMEQLLGIYPITVAVLAPLSSSFPSIFRNDIIILLVGLSLMIALVSYGNKDPSLEKIKIEYEDIKLKFGESRRTAQAISEETAAKRGEKPSGIPKLVLFKTTLYSCLPLSSKFTYLIMDCSTQKVVSKIDPSVKRALWLADYVAAKKERRISTLLFLPFIPIASSYLGYHSEVAQDFRSSYSRYSLFKLRMILADDILSFWKSARYYVAFCSDCLSTDAHEQMLEILETIEARISLRIRRLSSAKEYIKLIDNLRDIREFTAFLKESDKFVNVL